MHICKHCNTEFETIDSLRRHSSRVHKISSQELYNDIILKGNIPMCKCGCGGVPSFISFDGGYKEWIRGHIARVENNWGHNQQAIENSAQTRREQYQSGERKVWNDGLTKEIDERVENYGIKASMTIKSNTNEIKRRSRWLSIARKIKKEFQTKFGKESANWKGGTSSINNLVRANKRLYTEWIYPRLKEQNFTCQECNSNTELEVHHNKETMSEILQKFVDKNKEYNFDEKRNIMDAVIDYHISNNISGKTLCKHCHSKLHPSYNL